MIELNGVKVEVAEATRQARKDAGIEDVNKPSSYLKWMYLLAPESEPGPLPVLDLLPA